MQERSVVFYAPNQILSVSKVRLIELWRLSDENFKIFKFSYDYCVRLNNQISTDYKFPSLPSSSMNSRVLQLWHQCTFTIHNVQRMHLPPPVL